MAGLEPFEADSSIPQDIVELSARQVMGATVFSGTPENPILFLKSVGIGTVTDQMLTSKTGRSPATETARL
jgi:hypothetical protein